MLAQPRYWNENGITSASRVGLSETLLRVLLVAIVGLGKKEWLGEQLRLVGFQT